MTTDRTTGGAPPFVACSAPFASMDFDPGGNVQVCCANSVYPLGNVADASIREIWDGARAGRLRDAMRSNDFSVGCMVCRHRMEYSAGEVPREYYSTFPVESAAPEWPQLLSFSLHNTCNLECIMCGADLSSKIRAHRTDLAPLPHVYGDRFFEELTPFLDHCTAIDMAGGEPFLIREHRRIWELLEQLDHQPKISVTTNGTVWNEHVERVLARFDINLCVSVDGVTPSTFEKVRAGASFDTVMTNLDRFERYAAERGTGVFLSFSMIRQNWFELGSVLRFAEDRGMLVSVQTVQEPEFGVQRFPTPELRLVVETLEAEDLTLSTRLRLNLDVWSTQLDRLRSELAERERGAPRPLTMEPPSADNPGHVGAGVVAWAGRARSAGARLPADDAVAELARWSDRPVARIDLDRDGFVVAGDVDAVVPGCGGADVVRPGADLGEVLGRIESTTGAGMWIGEEVDDGARMLHTLWFNFSGATRDRCGFVLRMISLATPDGVTVIVGVDPQLMPRRSSAQPVTLSPRAR